MHIRLTVCLKGIKEHFNWTFLVTGGFVLYSPQALREVYIAAQYLKMFRFDDIYAGLL